MLGFGKPKISDPYNTMGNATPKPARASRVPDAREGWESLPPVRHVTRASRAAARAIEREYPDTRQHDSVTFAGDQVRHMADRARARGDNAVARELARAADQAARHPNDEVGFLKFP